VDARGQIASLLAAIDRLGVDDLGRLALPPGDRGDRVTARERALADADEAGLRPLVDEAAREARDLVIRAFASNQYQPTWAGLQWGRSLGSARDRANLIVAVEDAVLAAAVSDVAEADDVAVLAEPIETLLAMRARYPEQSLPGAFASRSRMGALGLAILLGLALFFGALALGAGAIPS
jgi:hypothetical protein